MIAIILDVLFQDFIIQAVVVEGVRVIDALDNNFEGDFGLALLHVLEAWWLMMVGCLVVGCIRKEWTTDTQDDAEGAMAAVF